MVAELVQLEGGVGDRVPEPERYAQPVAVEPVQAVRVLGEIDAQHDDRQGDRQIVGQDDRQVVFAEPVCVRRAGGDCRHGEECEQHDDHRCGEPGRPAFRQRFHRRSHLAGPLVFGNAGDEDPANDRKDGDKTGQDVDQPPVLGDQEAGREQVAVAAPFARRHLHGENDQHQEQAIDEQRQRQPERIEGGLREGGLQARADRRRAQRFLDPCDEGAAEDPGGRDDGRGGSRQHLDPGGAGCDAAVLGVGDEADQGRDDARLHLDQEGEQQADEKISSPPRPPALMLERGAAEGAEEAFDEGTPKRPADKRQREHCNNCLGHQQRVRDERSEHGLSRPRVPAGFGPARNVEPDTLVEMLSGGIGDDDDHRQRQQHGQQQQQVDDQAAQQDRHRQHDVAKTSWREEAAVVAHVADRHIVAHIMVGAAGKGKGAVGLVSGVVRSAGLAIALGGRLARCGGAGRPGSHRRDHAGADVAAARNGGKIIHASDQAVLVERLQRPEAKGSGAYPAARKRDAEKRFVRLAVPQATAPGYRFLLLRENGFEVIVRMVIHNLASTPGRLADYIRTQLDQQQKSKQRGRDMDGTDKLCCK